MSKWSQSATITSKNMFIRTFLFFNRNFQKREFKLYNKPFDFSLSSITHRPISIYSSHLRTR